LIRIKAIHAVKRSKYQTIIIETPRITTAP